MQRPGSDNSDGKTGIFAYEIIQFSRTDALRTLAGREAVNKDFKMVAEMVNNETVNIIKKSIAV